MRTTIGLILAIWFWFGCGVFIGAQFFPKQTVVYKTVNTACTDDQLLQWWFGDGDKEALRGRICK